jgi:hypothetical protein
MKVYIDLKKQVIEKVVREENEVYYVGDNLVNVLKIYFNENPQSNFFPTINLLQANQRNISGVNSSALTQEDNYYCYTFNLSSDNNQLSCVGRLDMQIMIHYANKSIKSVGNVSINVLEGSWFGGNILIVGDNAQDIVNNIMAIINSIQSQTNNTQSELANKLNIIPTDKESAIGNIDNHYHTIYVDEIVGKDFNELETLVKQLSKDFDGNMVGRTIVGDNFKAITDDLKILCAEYNEKYNVDDTLINYMQGMIFSYTLTDKNNVVNSSYLVKSDTNGNIDITDFLSGVFYSVDENGNLLTTKITLTNEDKQKYDNYPVDIANAQSKANAYTDKACANSLNSAEEYALNLVSEGVKNSKQYTDEKIQNVNSGITDETAKLQREIDAINNSQNLVDIVGTYTDLIALDKSNYHENDKIQVIQDETHDNASDIYVFQSDSWNFVNLFGNCWLY